jgi:hypothetical protein
VHNSDKLGSEGNHQWMLELPTINQWNLQKGKRLKILRVANSLDKSSNDSPITDYA